MRKEGWKEIRRLLIRVGKDLKAPQSTEKKASNIDQPCQEANG